MPNGFAALGDLLVGGNKASQQNQFYTGQLQQGQVSHLSAQTEEALANAKKARLTAKAAETEQEATENLADAFFKGGLAKTPDEATALATIAKAKQGTFETLAKGKGELQTQGFRSTIANPDAAPDARLGASMGITGKPESPLVAAPQESVNAFAPNTATAPIVSQTPLGAANTGRANRSPNPASGNRTPIGFEADPENPGQLRPIKGGPQDPEFKNMGSREATFFNRVVGGANQAIGDIKNIVQLPIGASSGVFGVGASPGSSLLASAKGVLTNKIASQDVQDYNSMLPGLARSMAAIETAGLVPPETFTHSFDALNLREGDTELTKMGKLAQMRQIITRGLEPSLSNPRVPKAQKEYVQKLVNEIREAIPFERQDIIALRKAQEKNPAATLNDLIGRNGLRTPQAQNSSPGTKPKSVVQNGHTYTLNEATGEYE